jgi:hypothetical protein
VNGRKRFAAVLNFQSGLAGLILKGCVMDGFNPDQVAVRNAHFIGGRHVEGGAVTTLSPIISKQEMERIDGIVQRAVAGGGQLVTGGRRVSTGTDGAFYLPTILINVDDRMEAVRTSGARRTKRTCVSRAWSSIFRGKPEMSASAWSAVKSLFCPRWARQSARFHARQLMLRVTPNTAYSVLGPRQSETFSQSVHDVIYLRRRRSEERK